MEQKQRSYYVADTIKEMTFLVKKDCILKKVTDDRNNPRYKVFLFEDSPYLQECLKDYK